MFETRTEEQAQGMYSHGMEFLRAHRLLTSLSQRLGPTLNLDNIFLKFTHEFDLVDRRHNLMFWLGRPKVHATRLYSISI